MIRSVLAILALTLAATLHARADDGDRGRAADGEKPADGGGTVITGRVAFDGEPPERKPIDMSAVQQCAERHEEPVLDESVIVNANGTLRNVIVYVEGAPARPVTKDDPPAVIDQVGCRYEPHVLAVRVGQEIRLKNSDPFLHNLHPLPVENDIIGRGAPFKEVTRLAPFKVHEFFPVKCDVHPWMLMYIGVFENEFFATTGEDGSFEIKGVPPGEYKLVTWHEKYGRKEQPLKIAGGAGDEPVRAEFRYKPGDEKNDDEQREGKEGER